MAVESLPRITICDGERYATFLEGNGRYILLIRDNGSHTTMLFDH